VVDFGQMEGGALYIVMEYVQGRDLAQVLAEDWPLPEERVCHVAAQVLAALGAAHRAGVIHRDLKPENIMLERIGDDPDFAKVLDFGLAKVAGGDGLGKTRGDLVCGTPQYMSPEQATGGAVDGRADLYAMGVILYRMIAGVLPFEGRNPMDFLAKHATEKPLPPRDRRPDARCSQALSEIVMRALEKDPARRYQNADDFRKELLAVEAAAAPAQALPVVRGNEEMAGFVAIADEIPVAVAQPTPEEEAAAAARDAARLAAAQAALRRKMRFATARRLVWLAVKTALIAGVLMGAAVVASRRMAADTFLRIVAYPERAVAFARNWRAELRDFLEPPPEPPPPLAPDLSVAAARSNAAAALAAANALDGGSAPPVPAAGPGAASAVPSAAPVSPNAPAPPAASAAPAAAAAPGPAGSQPRTAPGPIGAAPAAPAAPVAGSPESLKRPVAARAGAPPPVPDGPAGPCPRGMVFIVSGMFPFGEKGPGRSTVLVQLRDYCIDAQELAGPDGKPMTGLDYAESAARCSGLGRRLCTEEEWERACKGPSSLRFPYGPAFVPGACNVVGAAPPPEGALEPLGEPVAAPAGAYSRCSSGYGVHDMVGNVAEWTAPPLEMDAGPVLKGGSARDPGPQVSCARRELPAEAVPAFSGTRCCASPR